MMKLSIQPVTAFQQNCSLVVCEATGQAALIDPGGDQDRLIEMVQASGAQLQKILLTHGHIDHCGEAGLLARRLGIPVEGPHIEDAFWIDQLALQGRMFGFPALQPFAPERWLEEGDTVEVGQIRFEVLHCPGHTPGHVVFFHRDSKLAFVGDVLFQGSMGRTDFPRGNAAQLIHSIRHKLFPLGDDIRFVPGHGEMSTFGDERRRNPYVSDNAVGAR